MRPSINSLFIPLFPAVVVANLHGDVRQAEAQLRDRLAAWITRNIFRIKGKE